MSESLEGVNHHVCGGQMFPELKVVIGLRSLCEGVTNGCLDDASTVYPSASRANPYNNICTTFCNEDESAFYQNIAISPAKEYSPIVVEAQTPD